MNLRIIFDNLIFIFIKMLYYIGRMDERKKSKRPLTLISVTSANKIRICYRRYVDDFAIEFLSDFIQLVIALEKKKKNPREL